MISTDRLFAFTAAALLVIVIPGPSVLFVVGRALAHGRRTALATIAGNVLGTYLVIVAVALGVGSVVERSAALFLTVKLVGAAYLVYLGVQAFRHRGDMAVSAMDTVGGRAARSDLRTVAEGFVVGVTNPKTIVFFAAVLPQFVDRTAGNVPVQMLVLGLVPVCIGLITDTVWGLGATAARGWFARSERRLSLVGGAGGAAMVGLGVTVAVTGRAD
ncbi:LysE family translocator [Streptomyces clavuligerus]|nr:LysE family translocator [Streptomyces clavuligerus]ANW21727.1 lysine transporter LysE [Streptomyces clavuligerus]MBY6301052.1 LysE family translocator [Streptomyces clavuligerus]QCS09141.1 LysE family translocator [Streptomyces clavuligerus]QPJ96499.1 LysE family translocator [Streptomyces clavuligerus]WDN55326.1 LysE family translocator [Streptomyces clavuligerus]